MTLKPKIKKKTKSKPYRIEKEKKYTQISRNTAVGFLKNQKPFQRIIYTPLGKSLRQNKELNKAIKLLINQKEINNIKGKNFSIERLTHNTKLKTEENNTHTNSFKINITIDGKEKNLFLKLYNQKDYNIKNPIFIELHKGHNEFIALEFAKVIGLKVIPAHLAFTNLKKVNNNTILESGIVYDFTNMQRLDKYLLKDRANRIQMIEKHHKLNLKLQEIGVRDGFTKNVFIDQNTSELYFFDLYHHNIDLSKL